MTNFDDPAESMGAALALREHIEAIAAGFVEAGLPREMVGPMMVGVGSRTTITGAGHNATATFLRTMANLIEADGLKGRGN